MKFETSRVVPSLFACLAACGGPAAPGRAPVEGATGAPVSDPSSAPDIQKLVAGEHQLSIALYRDLARAPGNFFISPYSIEVALSMTEAGARGDTERAFTAVLDSGLDPSAHAGAIQALDATLRARSGARPSGSEARGTAFEFTNADRLFAQSGYAIEAPFLTTLERDYRAPLQRLDFARAPAASLQAVDAWVAEATEGRIPRLLTTLDPATRLLLVNAIAFKASWATPFNAARTAAADFHLQSGSTKRVPMMSASPVEARAATVGGADVIALPYVGRQIEMVIIAPPAGQAGAVEAALTPAAFDAYLTALGPAALTLTLPKFEASFTRDLVPALGRLGLAAAFSERADFSGISAEESLRLDSVVHSTFVRVDENGTEAVAATAAGVGATALPLTRTVTIDRPFVFAIIDRPTRTVLFLGRITDPTAVE